MTLVNDLWTYRGLVGNLAQRELKAKYKRSILGWAWSLINPATTLAIYAVVFGVLLKVQPPVAGNGQLKSFALYLFAGLVIWNFFQAVATGAMSSLIGAGPLLKKVFFPAECAPAANLLVAMSQSTIEATILVGILIVVGNASITMLMVPVLLVLLAVFSFGVGLVLSVANVYYRDVNYLVAVLLNLLFYATPIVYPESLVKDRGPTLIQWAVAINPLNHFVQAIRSSVYALQWPSAIDMLILLAFSFGTFLLGWAVFHRFGSRISEEI